MSETSQRYGFESFDCAPALRIEANEKLNALQFAQLHSQLARIEQMMERLEKRLWLAVYGVVAVVLAQAFQSINHHSTAVKTPEENGMDLEHKFCRIGGDVTITDGSLIEGYASLFGKTDQGGDVVESGAYKSSLERLSAKGGNVKMLWQHDPAQPIGIWDEVREDAQGLWVKGRILTDVARGREAAALIEAGAIDGLSIGYRTVRSQKNGKGGRLLSELELWEVSVVTFPMLPDARVGAKGDAPEAETMREMAEVFQQARRSLANLETSVSPSNKGRFDEHS